MVAAAARYTLFVRLMSPEQLGLAATIILTASFFDTVTDTGSDRFLIQDDSGEAPDALSMVHFVLIARGVGTAALLVLLASSLAAFYKAPQLTTGFYLLSAYPLIYGFVNADARRQQRYHDFRPDSACLIWAESMSLVAAVVTLLIWRNYYAAIAALVVRALMIVLVSNIVATVKYEVKYSKTFAVKISRFGAPLMFNGVGLFLGGQGDRLVIARALSLTELGVYSAVSLLIYYPSALLGRYLSGLQLPIVAAAKHAGERRDEMLSLIAGGATLFAIGQAAGFALVAPLVIPIIYGPRFSQLLSVVAIIGFLQASRFIRNWPTNVALGLGRSLPVLVSNIVRLVGLPLAIVGGWAGLGLMGLAGSFVIGELVAAVVSLLMINRILEKPWSHDLDRVAEFATCGALTVVSAWMLQAGGLLSAGLPLALTGLALALTLARERRAMAYGFNLGWRMSSRLWGWSLRRS
jgi:O-antigen/teichoic acid export membrane protein